VKKIIMFTITLLLTLTILDSCFFDKDFYWEGPMRINFKDSTGNRLCEKIRISTQQKTSCPEFSFQCLNKNQNTSLVSVCSIRSIEILNPPKNKDFPISRQR
jgi:hypothetical protein